MATIFTVLRFFGTLLEVILLFNLLIIVHELGHYWAAKWRGLKVEKFQIWFGPAIWKKTINGVQWGLGSIPAGGFVALPQMAPMDVIEGTSPDGTNRTDLPQISPLDKIIVAFAGPLFSFLLALVFAVVVWQVGRPVHSSEATTVIGFVAPDMPAAKAGIKVGDKVVSINGNPIRSFYGLTDSVISGIALSEGDTVNVVVERPGVAGQMNFDIKPAGASSGGVFDRGTTRKIGIGTSYLPIVSKILPGSPAERAGFQPGDVVKSVDGVPVWAGEQVDAAGAAYPGQDIVTVVERGGANGAQQQQLEIKVLAVKPLKPEHAPVMIGAVWKGEYVLVHQHPWVQVKKAASTILTTIHALISSTSDISVKHLSGPIGIGGAFYDMLSLENGWRLALWFGVVVNVNLALLNLLPLPILDGGHIVLAVLEKIRRKQISTRFLEYLQTAFAILLLGFMLYVTVLDVGDRSRRPAEEPKESPTIVFPSAP